MVSETENEFDLAASQAEQELATLKANAAKEKKEVSLSEVSAWWKKWFMKAGHKRLGRILSRA